MPNFLRRAQIVMADRLEDATLGMCDILVLTFLYNLFFSRKSESRMKIFERNAPRLKEYCQSLLSRDVRLSRYFEARKFNLYI